ncbi:cytochrome c maturation protein CcmE [Bacteroidia bacterium]|jgi:cytochrome c-type biogenesis protein CcmE|nr:cytochrome c maturation protein CcmE [Bacteroidia bacterium]
MKPKVIILLVILAVAIAGIMTTYAGAEKSATFEEADDNPKETFHITGFLMKDMPMEYNPQIDPNYFSFFIKDKAGNIRKVVSLEPKQQDFERAETVNMYGKSDGDVFRASKVMPKCPSKYKDEQNNKTAQSSY